MTKGGDPAAAKQANRNAETFSQLATEYLTAAKLRVRSWPEDDRIIRVELLPEWKSRTAKEITRRDVQYVLQKIVARGSLVMANRTLTLIRRIFDFGIDNE